MKQTYLIGTSVLIMEGFDYLLQNKRLYGFVLNVNSMTVQKFAAE